MTEEEALIRAREAAASCEAFFDEQLADVRAGKFDHSASVKTAKRALLDLDKPVPVDRDLADLRELRAACEEANGYPESADNIRAMRSGKREALNVVLPTFRAIIERRIQEQAR